MSNDEKTKKRIEELLEKIGERIALEGDSVLLMQGLLTLFSQWMKDKTRVERDLEEKLTELEGKLDEIDRWRVTVGAEMKTILQELRIRGGKVTKLEEDFRRLKKRMP